MKQWLAQLGEQRIDQMIDPELTFQMAVLRPIEEGKAQELPFDEDKDK